MINNFIQQRRLTLQVILLHALLLGQCVYAQKIFDITITDYGNLNQTIVDALILQVETEALTKIPNVDQSKFFSSMANASAMATKTLGSDPINEFEYAMIGLGVGAGLDLDDKNFDDMKDANGDYDFDSAPGAGVAGAFTIGSSGRFIKSKRFDMKKWAFFLNYFPYNYEKDDVEIKIRTTGLHARYQLWEGKEVLPWNMFNLMPVYVTFGYDHNKLTAKYTDVFNISKLQSSYSATFNATGVIDVDVTTVSLPLEISSGLQIGYLLTLYGGLGMDLNFGEGQGNASLTNSAVTLSDGTNTATGTASLSLGDNGDPKNFFSRYFAGVQFNLWRLKVYAQAEKTFGRNLYNAQAGIRMIF